MKKVLVLGLLALAVSTLSQQQASAWVNSRFGMGLNWDYQAGGNSVAWGLFRGNQPGGADPAPHCQNNRYGPACPTPGPVLVPAPAPKMIVPAPAPGSPALIPMGVPMDPTTYGVQGYHQGYVSPYQFATYPRPVYYYYYYPTYAR